jgi:hypothetical protein
VKLILSAIIQSNLMYSWGPAVYQPVALVMGQGQQVELNIVPCAFRNLRFHGETYPNYKYR